VERNFKEHYHLMVKNVKDFAIFTMDPRGNNTSWNPGVGQVLGYKEEEFIGQPCSLIFTTEDIQQGVPEQELKKALSEGRALDERWYLRKDGSRFFASGVLTPLRDESGNLKGFSKMVRDITERKRAEQEIRQLNETLERRVEERTAELHDAKERFRRAFDDAAIGMAMTGLDGRYLRVNKALCAMLGYSEEEMLSSTFKDITHPEDQAVSVEYAQRLLEGEVENYRLEKRYVHKDGRTVWVLLSASAVKDLEGTPLYLIAQSQEVTQRKRAEEARARLATIVESSDDAIISRALDGTIISWNRGAERLYGYTAEEVVGRSSSFLYPPEDSHEMSEILGKTRRGESVERYETVRMTKDGRRVHVSLTVSPIRDAAGNITGDSGIARNITEQKMLEEALRESEARFRAIFEQSAVGISIATPERTLLETNRAYQELTGYSGEELFGKPIAELSCPEDVPEDWELNEELHSGKLDRYQREKRYVRKDGEVIWVSPTVSAVRDEEGKPRFLVGVVEDVTGRKRVEQALREANRRLEELAVMRADFTAMVAHELDTPIATIRGLLDMLETGELDDSERNRLLAIIQTELDGLVVLISDAREAATVEREDFTIHPRRVTIGELLREAAVYGSMLPGDHPLEVRDAASGEVRADSQRIGQVLRNLISNAAKYSSDGAPIELRARTDEDWVRIEVADRGSGIHPDDARHIFEKFGRGRDASGRKRPGVGLGLYICRRIIQTHKSELTLDSTPGEGSVFGFSLESVR
jgi:PAS domain S-box-containing protein